MQVLEINKDSGIVQFRQIGFSAQGTGYGFDALEFFDLLDFVSFRKKRIFGILALCLCTGSFYSGMKWIESARCFLRTGVIINFGVAVFSLCFSSSLLHLLWAIFASVIFVSLDYFLVSFTKTLESAKCRIQVVV